MLPTAAPPPEELSVGILTDGAAGRWFWSCGVNILALLKPNNSASFYKRCQQSLSFLSFFFFFPLSLILFFSGGSYPGRERALRHREEKEVFIK